MVALKCDRSKVLPSGEPKLTEDVSYLMGKWGNPTSDRRLTLLDE
ncbi:MULTISPECIES: hypothetical protein [unclassified Coleofasciculus]|nr:MULTISPECIES: hypothetical protein [unclassified Coleofasciculus]